MIGILCKDSEKEVVREFFELFKTPWEFIVPGRQYEVVVSTVSEGPIPYSYLSILYSSTPTCFDAQKGIVVERTVLCYFTNGKGIDLPIYGPKAILNSQGQPVLYDPSKSPIIASRFLETRSNFLRVGYDLFHEVKILLSEGQSSKNALIPTLELHISLLREWILDAGIPLVEIPPVPWGYEFIACLTHDVDFGGIRLYKLDHTLLGFIYRAFFGSFVGLLKRRFSFSGLMKNWIAVFSLPFVYLGIVRDFWDDFKRYAEIEKSLVSTYFFIPFKDRAGKKVKSEFAAWRATRYDITDMREQIRNLLSQGFEIGLHGIDAWHDVEKGKQEFSRIVAETNQNSIGVRMHWLCFGDSSFKILEQAGFDYDSTFGYNDAVGYKSGSMQAFRPLGVERLIEVPLNIQDTALFSSKRMGLTQAQAWKLCRTVLETAIRFGGVVTILWHQRSLAPDRMWDEFYVRLLKELKSCSAWFATATQVVQWFRRRRSVMFEDARCIDKTVRLCMRNAGKRCGPPMRLRLHKPSTTSSSQLNAGHSHIDCAFRGESPMEIQLD